MAEPSPVVTRFAPSPTGMLHIGGARTALFNQLYARHTGGRFLIRVEDTDRERSTPEAVGAIFRGLEWMGLMPDEPATFQFARADRHRAVVDQLLASRRAYRDFLSEAEADDLKEQARLAGGALRSPWRDRDPPIDAGRPFAVRFRVPEGETVVEDAVRGTVRFANKDLEDLVLLRSDGAPTYNLAVTIDDHDMGVTHVIRGEEHLSNAARQTLLYQAMEWPTPTFAHLPLIHGPDGTKLSKRHGAQSVGDYADMGYLPEAVRNYLARLGWGHGDAEIFTDAEAAAWFDVKDVVKAPARLDWAKLNHINQHYLRQADDGRLATLIADRARVPAEDPRLGRVIPLVKEAAQTLVQLADLCVFALKTRPLSLDEKTAKLLNEETHSRLGRLRARLKDHVDWSAPALEPLIRAFAEAEGIGIGKFGPALRGVLSGGSPAPDLAGALAALGREEALGRLEDALSPSV